MRVLLGVLMVLSGVGAVALSLTVASNGAVVFLGLVMCLIGALLAQSTPRREEKK
ncbi:hypothetical protein SCB71_14635 [Herbiconiux sp. KACC 21604]|uniref:hypothetical protein n=1 Tax=unclassified Herbiconiux TaxID=2618217 RepID=UPI0014927975|nr:hypothetical protein [Herbiconiux sp. SALV-R1]QJU54379.1 hypothetical protein HL652_12575 [Herbiconiux sp. SALV-R1]WPO85450.1 hypothetical protein SCB71_14635 [Herbiconiux sp. KACC 21604]